MGQLQIPVSIPGSKKPFKAPAPVVQPESLPAPVGGGSHSSFNLKVFPPRVPCITLNAFAFPVKDTVVEKIFNALGGKSLVEKAGGKYASGSFSSLSVFFRSEFTSANHVQVSYNSYTDTCTVTFSKFSLDRCQLLEVQQQCENVPFSLLPTMFADATGLQFN
jgi:hypothetical protein